MTVPGLRLRSLRRLTLRHGTHDDRLAPPDRDAVDRGAAGYLDVGPVDVGRNGDRHRHFAHSPVH
jgi:hypothetical protein